MQALATLCVGVGQGVAFPFREFEFMTSTRIIDWDDAYANAAHIPGGSD